MRLHTPPLARGEFLRDIPLLDEFVHRVGRTALSGAVVLEQTRVLFIQRLLPPGNQTTRENTPANSLLDPHTQTLRLSVYLCNSFSFSSSCSMTALSSM